MKKENRVFLDSSEFGGGEFVPCKLCHAQTGQGVFSKEVSE